MLRQKAFGKLSHTLKGLDLLLQLSVDKQTICDQKFKYGAFYKKLYGVISNQRNDTMFYLGLAYAGATPMIGIFDENMWPQYHGVMAGIVFVCFMIYATMLASSLFANKDKFPAEEQGSIQKM